MMLSTSTRIFPAHSIEPVQNDVLYTAFHCMRYIHRYRYATKCTNCYKIVHTNESTFEDDEGHEICQILCMNSGYGKWTGPFLVFVYGSVCTAFGAHIVLAIVPARMTHAVICQSVLVAAILLSSWRFGVLAGKLIDWYNYEFADGICQPPVSLPYYLRKQYGYYRPAQTSYA